MNTNAKPSVSESRCIPPAMYVAIKHMPELMSRVTLQRLSFIFDLEPPFLLLF